MCKSDRLGSAKTDTGYYNYGRKTSDRLSISQLQCFLNNSNLKLYKKRNVISLKSKVCLPIRLFSQCKLPHLPVHTDSALHIL